LNNPENFKVQKDCEQCLELEEKGCVLGGEMVPRQKRIELKSYFAGISDRRLKS
jgi:hypothetical protein